MVISIILDWMMPIILLGLISVVNVYAKEYSKQVCSISSFDYKGKYYSQNYTLPVKNGIQPCHDRKKIDATALGAQHKSNREMINSLLNKILNDQSCQQVHSLVKDYQAQLQNEKDQTVAHFKAISSGFEEYKSEFDIQRLFAFGAAFNTTCSGEHNGESVFIDFNMINKILVPLKPIQANNPALSPIGEVRTDSGLSASCSTTSRYDNKTFRDLEVPAAGDVFDLTFYSTDDQVMVKSQNGKILFDSGCKAPSPFMFVRLNKPPEDANVLLSVISNCQDSAPETKEIAYAVHIDEYCKKDEEPCVAPRNVLAEFLRNEVDQYKNFLNINQNERLCFMHFHEDILKEMEGHGYFIREGEVRKNEFCELEEEACKQLELERLKNEPHSKIPTTISPIVQLPGTIQVPTEDTKCPKKPSYSESIFKHISWSYCKIGNKKLGLEPEPVTVPQKPL